LIVSTMTDANRQDVLARLEVVGVHVAGGVSGVGSGSNAEPPSHLPVRSLKCSRSPTA
jgi:hypothetical protein